MIIVKKDTYKVGDRVKIIDHRGKYWNANGEMDEYIGEILTIREAEYLEWGNFYHMKECPDWSWEEADFEGVVVGDHTNLSHIQSMSAEKLAQMLYDVSMCARYQGEGCIGCPLYEVNMPCSAKDILEWLKKGYTESNQEVGE